MKKIVSVFLTLVLCLLLIPAARAEEDDEKTKRLDTSRIQWAMAMTAHMAGNALDRMEEAQTSLERHYLKQFAQLPYMAPGKAVVLEFNKTQAAAAQRALGIQGWENVGPTVAQMVNQRFSDEYTLAADRAQAEGSTSLEYSKYFTLILLTCGNEISLTSLTAYGTVNSRSAFIISTRQINEDFGAADVDQYIAALSLEKPLVRIYEQADLDTMFQEDPWGTGASSFRHLANGLLASDRRRETLLTAWMGSDSPYITVEMRFGMMIELLRSMETADQATLIQLASDWLPRLGENVSDPVDKLLQEGNTAQRMPIAPPAIEYGEELHETALKEDGTYLVVFRRTVPDKEPEAWYDVILEAALPVENIPTAVEDADYIILCSVTYEGGVSRGETHLHYPLTHITVHDARTGELLRDLGSVKRTLSGVVMLPKGDTWWSPLYGKVWAKIQPLFMEQIIEP